MYHTRLRRGGRPHVRVRLSCTTWRRTIQTKSVSEVAMGWCSVLRDSISKCTAARLLFIKLQHESDLAPTSVADKTNVNAVHMRESARGGKNMELRPTTTNILETNTYIVGGGLIQGRHGSFEHNAPRGDCVLHVFERNRVVWRRWYEQGKS